MLWLMSNVVSEKMFELVTFLRERFGADLPDTWTFSFGSRGRSWDDYPIVHDGDVPMLVGLVTRLDAALRGPGEQRRLLATLVLNTDPPELFSTFEPETLSPCTVVLDSQFRYPNDHYAGGAVPDDALPSARPTDPEVLRGIEALAQEFAEHHRRITGQLPQFDAAATEEEILAVERGLGRRFPEDLRALYVLGAGVGEGDFGFDLLGNYWLYPLATRSERWRMGYTDHPFPPLMLSPVVFESYPFGAVRRVSSSDCWIPIGRDGGCNECGVDLDPGPSGRYGQVLEFGRDFGLIGVVAESVRALVSRVVETMRGIDIGPDQVADFWESEDRCFDFASREPRWQTGVHGTTTADVAAALAGREDVGLVQSLTISHKKFSVHHVRADRGSAKRIVMGANRDSGRLDLGVLSVVPNLRNLEVAWNGEVDPWLPGQVESFRLDARFADIGALAGHPGLWSLALAGMPVRVADLAALPGLLRLDLAYAEVDDVLGLADLDVRVLTLNTRQWARLRRASRLPRRLAGAQWVPVRPADHLPTHLANTQQWVGEEAAAQERAQFTDWLRATVE